MKQYRWASLGCGIIANELAQAMAMQGRTLAAIGNRTYEKAVAFAEKYNIPKVYETIDQMFEDDDIDIIYISTPHNTHLPFLLKALENGKHVLCEKSITLNSQELEKAVRIAEKKNLVLAEAMTLYHMPLYKKIKEVIAKGELGRLQFIQMNFGSYKDYDMTNRFFNKNLAGGALLDIGVYALSFVRWFMSQKPSQVSSQVRYAPTGVDEQAGILLMNDQGEMATISLTLHAKQPKRGTIAYEKGYIEIFDYPRGEKAVITYTEDQRQQVIESGSTSEALLYEVQDMERTIATGVDEMHLDYSIDVMDIMTSIRQDWGMKYPEEE